VAGFGTWTQRLSDFAFGYDFFVSYKQDDGRFFPRRLATRLTALGFRVFLDENVYVAGDNLSLATQRRVRMSSYLLLVARPGAMSRSPWVLREVELSLAANRLVIVINVNDAFLKTTGETREEIARSATLRSLLGSRLSIPLQTGEATSIFDGNPPEHLLEEIKRSFKATRQDTRRSRVFAAATVAFALLAAIAIFFAWQADAARARAEHEGRNSRATALAARSDLVRSARPQLAGLLARLSVQISTSHSESPTPAARQALLESVLGLNGRTVPDSKGPATLSARSAGGSWLASATGSLLQLWSFTEGSGFKHVRDVTLAGDLSFVHFGYGERWLVAGNKDFICFLSLGGDRPPDCETFESDDGLLETESSPDGRILVGIRYSSSVVAWSLEASAPISSKRLLGRDLPTVRNAAFSGDGKWLITWGITSSELWLWKDEDIRNGAVPTTLKGHNSPVKTAAVSGSAGVVASADDDGTILLWTLPPGPTAYTVLVPSDGKQWTTKIGFSPDGMWLAAPRRLGLPGKSDEAATEILLYRMLGQSAELQARLPHDSYADEFSFDPASRFLLALGTNGTNWLWTLRGPFDERRSRLIAHQWPSHEFAFSGDGRWLVTADDDGKAFAWSLDCQSPRPIATPFNGLEGRFTTLLFGMPKGWLVGGDRRNLRYWDATLPTLGEPLVLADNCKANLDELTSSPSNRWFAALTQAAIALFDGSASNPFARADLPTAGQEVDAIQFSANDAWLAACLKDGEIAIWDLTRVATTSVPRWRWPTPDSSCHFMNFSDDGAFLLSADVDTQGSLWDLRSTAAAPPRIELRGEKIGDFRVSRAGRYVTGLAYDEIWIWDRDAHPDSAKFVSLYKGEAGFRTLMFSRDGRWLIALQDDTALLWRLPAKPGERPRRLPFSDGEWTSVALSLDGAWLFIPAARAPELWKLSGADLPASPTALTPGPTRIAHPTFGPGSRWFACSEGATVYLWNVERPDQPPTVFDGAGADVESIAFSPDGLTITFGAYDGMVGIETLDDKMNGPIRVRAQSGSVRGLSVSSDGGWLLSATYSSIRAWPTRTDTLLQLGLDRIGREADPYELRFYLGEDAARAPAPPAKSAAAGTQPDLLDPRHVSGQ
jgi:WD40 repeat protein